MINNGGKTKRLLSSTGQTQPVHAERRAGLFVVHVVAPQWACTCCWSPAVELCRCARRKSGIIRAVGMLAKLWNLGQRVLGNRRGGAAVRLNLHKNLFWFPPPLLRIHPTSEDDNEPSWKPNYEELNGIFPARALISDGENPQFCRY